jgi:hypothetical protein
MIMQEIWHPLKKGYGYLMFNQRKQNIIVTTSVP